MNKNRFANYNSSTDKPQHSVYQTHILTRLEHWAVLCTRRQREIQEKTGHYPGADVARQSPLHKHKQLANTLTTGTQRLWVLSFPLHQHAVTHSQRISLSFWPASWERGRKRGRFWELHSLYVCLHISHQWGTLQHLFLFFHRHMTHSQSFLAPIGHNFWPPSFFGSLAQCGYAMASVISTRAKKQIIVFINSCHGHAPTHDSKEGAWVTFAWISQ